MTDGPLRTEASDAPGAICSASGVQSVDAFGLPGERRLSNTT